MENIFNSYLKFKEIRKKYATLKIKSKSFNKEERKEFHNLLKLISEDKNFIFNQQVFKEEIELNANGILLNEETFEYVFYKYQHSLPSNYHNVNHEKKSSNQTLRYKEIIEGLNEIIFKIYKAIEDNVIVNLKQIEMLLVNIKARISNDEKKLKKFDGNISETQAKLILDSTHEIRDLLIAAYRFNKMLYKEKKNEYLEKPKYLSKLLEIVKENPKEEKENDKDLTKSSIEVLKIINNIMNQKRINPEVKIKTSRKFKQPKQLN